MRRGNGKTRRRSAKKRTGNKSWSIFPKEGEEKKRKEQRGREGKGRKVSSRKGGRGGRHTCITLSLQWTIEVNICVHCMRMWMHVWKVCDHSTSRVPLAWVAQTNV